MDLPFYTDAYAVRLERKLREIQRLLATEKYAPSPLILVEVPKGTLAIRPGSVPTFADRIVLQSIIALIAPVIDPRISEAVYSYRVRDKKPDPRHGIFRESDVVDLPFLKSQTISRELDPFQSWYDAWPEFDEVSKQAFEEEGYVYLAVSDIAAYFENIQLLILRDQLLSLLPGEAKIVNLLFMFLEMWSTRTVDGRHHWRGVPQGTQIGSFLGNIFLVPLDEIFADFCGAHEAKYFRYMDDVKIFAKELSVARLAVLTMDRLLRRLHLNSQSAKTYILREHPNKEITHALVDERLEALEEIFDSMDEMAGDEHGTELVLATLERIARQRPRSPQEQPIFGARRPLKDLSLRTFRRLITAYITVGEHGFVGRLFDEIARNPDYRLTRKLIPRFPSCRLLKADNAPFQSDGQGSEGPNQPPRSHRTAS